MADQRVAANVSPFSVITGTEMAKDDDKTSDVIFPNFGPKFFKMKIHQAHPMPWTFEGDADHMHIYDALGAKVILPSGPDTLSADSCVWDFLMNLVNSQPRYEQPIPPDPRSG